MDFFEDVVSTAKDTFSAVCKKTEEVVSIQKMKINISSMESKLSKDYEALGRYCLDAVLASDASDEPAKALAEEIVKRREDIKLAKKALATAQGKAVCPKCGKEIASGTPFCPECGNNLSE